jgi:hypothetical protein
VQPPSRLLDYPARLTGNKLNSYRSAIGNRPGRSWRFGAPGIRSTGCADRCQPELSDQRVPILRAVVMSCIVWSSSGE